MSECAIGICAAVERVRRDPWDEVVTMVQRTYPDAVQRAGALALVLPPDEAAVDSPDLLLDRIDGLLLAGGADVDPESYGADRQPETGVTWLERDRFELALTRRAIERRIPVLGACRGMQILNIALGGTLHQDLPGVVGTDVHRHTPGVFGDHEVRLEPGSLAARAVGEDRTLVKSHHHQGLADLGDGLIATGWSTDDDLVEAVELRGEPYVLGVLWHPEQDEASRVIASLVEAARVKVGST
ncbi:MAG TPA: gamma-glutamyl-gamma-aminobutyrate hydrolase family protein [Solirubrobacterales bacterium]|nr:gamma-glutamyl-gamma-aminobutyrate hydrolase family protein [Solirubrobacterales bacterium]